jgi:hypothetical protein
MSFGYSVGDFVLLTQLAWKVVQNARKACGAHEELTREVTSLHLVLRRLEVEVSKPNSILSRSDNSLDRKEELAQLSGDCRGVLRVLDGILEKYNALSEEKRSVTKLWKKLKFGNGEMLDLVEIRLKISTSTSALTLFLNLLSIGSQGKVETYMESHGDELKEMRRSLNWITASMQAKSPKAGEGSILTTYAGDDKSIWKDFRRELIKEGFSSNILKKYKEIIKEYVLELGDRGALDDVEAGFEDGEMSLSDAGGSEELGHLAGQDSVDESEEETEAESVGSEERSEQSAEEEQEEDPRNCEQDLQSSTEHHTSDEKFEPSDDRATLNDHEPQLVDIRNSILDFGDPAAPSREGDEHTISKHTEAKVEAHPSSVSRIPLEEVNDGESQASQVTYGHKEAEILTKRAHREEATIEVTNFSKPRLMGGRDFSGVPRDLFNVLPKWFGPYEPGIYYHSISTDFWNRLQLQPEDIPIESKTMTEQFDLDAMIKSPHSFCNWVFFATQIYDQIQASTSSKDNTPNLLLPLAIELRLLVLRACAYYARIQISSAFKEAKYGPMAHQRQQEFRFRFREMLKALYEFIEDSICYTLNLQEKKSQDLLPKNLWMPTDNMDLPEEKHENSTKEPTPEEMRNKQTLVELGGQSSLDFVYNLLAENTITVLQHGLVRKSTLADFVPKVQELLLFFKRYCEDTLLKAECSQTFEHTIGLEHSIDKFEKLDPAVRRYVSELQKCEQALETWSVNNTYPNDIVKIIPFSRTAASLSVILERCDDAQKKIWYARIYNESIIVHSWKYHDKGRPRSRHEKKKR